MFHIAKYQLHIRTLIPIKAQKQHGWVHQGTDNDDVEYLIVLEWVRVWRIQDWFGHWRPFGQFQLMWCEQRIHPFLLSNLLTQYVLEILHRSDKWNDKILTSYSQSTNAIFYINAVYVWANALMPYIVAIQICQLKTHPHQITTIKSKLGKQLCA